MNKNSDFYNENDKAPHSIICNAHFQEKKGRITQINKKMNNYRCSSNFSLLRDFTQKGTKYK